MKTNQLFFMIVLLAGSFLLFTAFDKTQTIQNENFSPKGGLEFPEDVSEILDKSCFGCHNVESSNDKSKKGLLLDQLPELSKSKMIGKLSDIAEVVEKSEMPPEKFLDKYPDKALTEGEAKRLKEWAEQAAEDLLN